MTKDTTQPQGRMLSLPHYRFFSIFIVLMLFTALPQMRAQTVCPSIGFIDAPTTVCEGFPFTIFAVNLEDFTLAENNETDFQARLVYLPGGSTADPYTDGTELDSVTPDGDTAEFFEIGDQLAAGTYDLYVILSPEPANPSCRPSAVATIDLTACDDLGDFTFVDFDNNGTYDNDDVPLPLVLARLYDADTDTENLEFGPFNTDADGNYFYTAVPAGNYYFVFEAGPGYVASTSVVAGDNGNKMDASAGNGPTSTADFAFVAAGADFTQDAGFIGVGTISGNVWPDDDFEADFDETGTTGVELSLAWYGVDGIWGNADDVLLQRTTNAAGAYDFANLPYGEYRLTLTDVAGTLLAQGYDLITPSPNLYELTLNGLEATFTETNFIYQPQCLPRPGRLTTTDPLVLCGNEALGVYEDQEIAVRLNDYIAPVSVVEDYEFVLAVVDAAGEIALAQVVAVPANNATVVFDLTGLPFGNYEIHAVHYLTTDPELITPFDFNIGADFSAVTDQLSLIDGALNPTGGEVCGDVTLSANNLSIIMDPQPPAFLGCLGALNVSLNQECGVTITPPMVLVGDWACLLPSDFQVSIFQEGVLLSEDGTISGCGTYEYMVDVLVDGVSGFPCWGYINASDNTAPQITCPDDISGGIDPEGMADFICEDIERIQLFAPVAYIVNGAGEIVDIDPAIAAKLDRTGYPVLTDGCDFVRIYVSDAVEENGDCGATVITRTFFAEDKVDSSCGGSPNISNICTQEITFRNPNLDELVLPPNIIELDCSLFNGALNPTPEEIGAALGVLSHPAVFGFFDADPSTPEIDPHLLDQNFCNLGASYSDRPRIQLCGSTYVFLRDWYIIDKCDISTVVDFTQQIKIKDFTDPTLVLPTVDYNGDGLPDVRRFSTAPYACEANIPIPAPMELEDFCSGPPVLEVVVRDEDDAFVFSGTTGEVFTVPPGSYTLEYCATDDCGNESCVIMPIIVRDEIAPSIVCDDQLNVQIGGGDIINDLYGIARVFAVNVDEGSVDNCSTELTREVRRNYWEDDDCSLSSGDFSPWGEFVDFYCCDVGKEITLELRVSDELGNANQCTITIIPEDKLRPICFAPMDASVTCAEFPTLFTGDVQEAYDSDFAATSLLMSELFGGPTGTDNCVVDTLVERTPMININACGWGTIVRRFEAWQLEIEGDVNGNGTIDVNEVLRSTNACTQTIVITETHEYIVDFPADAEADCLDPDVPGIVTEALGCDNLIVNVGEPVRFSATGDECYKLSITYDVINWCIWDGEADPYAVARDTDTDDTEVDACERPVVQVDDSGAIIDRNHPEPSCDSGLPNATPVPDGQNVGRWSYTQFVKVYDSSSPTFSVADFGGPTPECPDLNLGEFPSLDNENCDAEITIEFTLDDACEVFDNGGNLVLSITAATIDYAAIDADDNGTIDATEFTPEGDVTPQVTDNGDATFSITLTAPIIPQATSTNVYHALRLEAIDGCGNPAVQYVVFKVIDCKAPAPICINGLTATLTPDEDGGCSASIWASDFVESPMSECSEPLGYAIYRAADVIAAGPDFIPSPVDTGLVLTLDDEEQTVIYVYAIDAEGNFGFCETYILVQPSFACIAFGAIGGSITTEMNEPVGNVQLNLSGPMPMTTMSEPDGTYLFDDLEEDLDYTVSAYRNDDPLNGVTTFDIIIINKHILALEPLSTPYKRIAADVNRSGTITTLDVIQIRKLILHINDEFIGNTSWRFIDSDYTFPAPENPWLEFFPELININDLIGEDLNAGFIGVKIGDVNDSADGNF